MTESWRSILERAAENLSVELDQMVAPGLRPAPAAAFGSSRLSPQLSFAESREMLARELQALAPRPPKQRPAQMQAAAVAPITHPVTVPGQIEQPKRSKPRKGMMWSSVMTAFLSAVITGGVAGYLLLTSGDFGKIETAQWTSNANAAGTPSKEIHPVAFTAPAALSRSTEDSFMQRASYQLNNGDGEGGRALYEVLAHHGSAHGAFALAETYDPGVLARHKNWGLKSDLRLARDWYKKASELGSLPAYERLKALESGSSRSHRGAQLARAD